MELSISKSGGIAVTVMFRNLMELSISKKNHVYVPLYCTYIWGGGRGGELPKWPVILV